MPTLPSGITRSSGTLYDVLTIDLGIARSDVKVEISGDVISVIEITGTLDVKLNEKDEPIIELDKATRITITPKKFTKLFFTNPTQTGKSATLYIGREASFVPEAQRVGSVGILDSADVRIDPSKSEETRALIDDTIKGLLRSIGDAGTAPSNITGETVLKKLNDVEGNLVGLYDRFTQPMHAITFTTTPLGANATYTSSGYDNNLGRLGFIGVLAFADQASATDGFMVEQSIDNINWDLQSGKTTVSANVGKGIKVAMLARYVRVKYINGGTAQTVFRLGGRFMIA